MTYCRRIDQLSWSGRSEVYAKVSFGFVFFQDSRFGAFQNAIHAAQERERQDNLAVVRLLVVTPENIRYRPDKGRQLVEICCHYTPEYVEFVSFERGL